ncbi:hypothetical protein EJ07DRAFT_150715 [Lizonia empirigonia]|nr:hypothetical protein EJ07DRAFT_150715 [Lizonia empirigonia]
MAMRRVVNLALQLPLSLIRSDRGAADSKNASQGIYRGPMREVGVGEGGADRGMRVERKASPSSLVHLYNTSTPPPQNQLSAHRVSVAQTPHVYLCQMLLLDLPPELFEQIITVLVREESPMKVVKCREVARESSHVVALWAGLILAGMFNTYVLDALLERPVERTIQDMKRKCQWGFFNSHGHAILCKLVLQRCDNNRAAITFVTGIVDMLVNRNMQSDTDNCETLRALYTRKICSALKTVSASLLRTLVMEEREIMKYHHQRLLPAAAAAVGDVNLFLDNINNVSEIFAVHHRHFPSALNAAVAAGQTEMVKTILWYAVNNTHGPWITGNWKEMRTTSMALFEALEVAIRVQQNEIGHLICSTISDNRHMHRSIRRILKGQLYEDSILHSNVEFLTLALHYKREGTWLPPDSSLDKPTRDEMIRLLKDCRKSMLGPLIRKKLLHLNSCRSVTTIWACLYLKRYDLVKGLIELGADINSEPPGGGMPAFWRATAEGRFEDAEFLFQQGASVQPWKPKERALPVLTKDKERTVWWSWAHTAQMDD